MTKKIVYCEALSKIEHIPGFDLTQFLLPDVILLVEQKAFE